MSANVKWFWHWTAWTKDRERIADTGWCVGRTRGEAITNAGMVLGGPHKRDVVELTVDPVARGHRLYTEDVE